MRFALWATHPTSPLSVCQRCNDSQKPRRNTAPARRHAAACERKCHIDQRGHASRSAPTLALPRWRCGSARLTSPLSVCQRRRASQRQRRGRHCRTTGTQIRRWRGSHLDTQPVPRFSSAAMPGTASPLSVCLGQRGCQRQRLSTAIAET